MGAITHHGIPQEGEGSTSHLQWKGQNSKSSLHPSPWQLKHAHVPWPQMSTYFIPGLWTLQDQSKAAGTVETPSQAPEMATLMVAVEPATPVAGPWLGFLISQSPLDPTTHFVSLVFQPSQWFQGLLYIYPSSKFLFAQFSQSLFLLRPTQNPDCYNTNGGIIKTNTNILNFLGNRNSLTWLIQNEKQRTSSFME